MFSTSFTWNDFVFLLQGAWVTLQLTSWAILLGTVAGLLFGLLRALQTIVTRIQEPMLVLCIAGLIYYVMSLVVARLGARLEKRWQEND